MSTESLGGDYQIIDVTGIDNIGKPVDLSFTPYYNRENKLEYEVKSSGYWTVAVINYKDGLPYEFLDMDQQAWKFLTIDEFQ